MKDEIKEILEDDDELLVNYKDGSFESFDTLPKNVLDYITNLQTIEQQYSAILSENAELENKLTNLQEENERLKETNVYCNRTDCVGRIKDSRKYNSVYQEKEDYKSRNEKAIEYINKEKYDIETTFKISSKDFLEENITSVVPSFKLLEILKEGK